MITFVALLVAIHIASANPVRSDVDGAELLVEQHVVRLTSFSPAFTFLNHLFENLFTQVFGQTNLRRVACHSGRLSGGQHATTPLSPKTITSRA